MKVFVRIAQAVLLLVVVLGLAWTAARLAPMPASQRAALRAMETPWRPAGSNAFDDLWLIGYRVPPARRRALVDADLRLGDANGNGPRPGDAAKAAGMPSVAPSQEDRDLLCDRNDDCLAKVAADRARYRALAARNAGLMRNIEQLRAHGHVRARGNPMHAIAPYQFAMASDTFHAVAFVDGEVEQALAGACTDFATWRRFAANNDSLIGAMVSPAGSERLARLIAAMAAQQPRGTPWPDACSAAFAPPRAGEGELGQALAGEFRFVSDETRRFVVDGPLTWLAYDAEDNNARTALRMHRLFDASARAAIAADRRLSRPAPASRALDWRCIGNAAGCMLNSIAEPSYLQYAWRMQDHRARLQLMSAVAWLRSQPLSDEPLGALLKRWPGQAPAPARQVEADDEAGALRISMFDRARGDYWSVPAPGSRVASAALPVPAR